MLARPLTPQARPQPCLLPTLATCPPPYQAQKAEFAFKHFEGDTNLSFALLEEDPVTKRPVRGGGYAL